MGALGVAIAAFEHLTGQEKAAARPSAAPAAAPPAGGNPASPPLPPLPGAPPAGSPPLPPLPSESAAAETRPAEALLLVRAMIAAAYADHQLDEAERGRIAAAINDASETPEERETLLAELERPLDLDALAAAVTGPEIAEQVYLASKMAIDVDSPSEEHYLRRLATKLGLDESRLQELDRALEADEEP